MASNRAPGGLLIAAVGAAVLALATFQPWYGVGVTSAGALAAQQQLASVAQQYGNPAFQRVANQIGARINTAAGRPVATLSAHQSMKNVSAMLLLLAGTAFIASLLGLAGALNGGGGSIAGLGALAALFVGFRMLDPPNLGGAYISLSLAWGSWLALGGAAVVAVGGLWSPR